jgi:hypothetical protein
VAGSLEKEAKVGAELAPMLNEGKAHLSEANGKLLQALGAESSKAFRELRYQDFMRDVLAVGSLVGHFKSSLTYFLGVSAGCQA